MAFPYLFAEIVKPGAAYETDRHSDAAGNIHVIPDMLGSHTETCPVGKEMPVGHTEHGPVTVVRHLTA